MQNAGSNDNRFHWREIITSDMSAVGVKVKKRRMNEDEYKYLIEKMNKTDTKGSKTIIDLVI